MIADIAAQVERLAEDFGIDKKRSIGEVAEEIGVEPHVIRFWEEHFEQIQPQIGKGGRRYYYAKQVEILKKIKVFLYEEGYTIAGLQKMLKKRKSSLNKQADIDVILDNDNFPQQSPKKTALNGNLEADLEPTNVLDDFIDGSLANIKHMKISDFIDPSLDLSQNIRSNHNLSESEKQEIITLTERISKNLNDLKSLLRE